MNTPTIPAMHPSLDAYADRSGAAASDEPPVGLRFTDFLDNQQALADAQGTVAGPRDVAQPQEGASRSGRKSASELETPPTAIKDTQDTSELAQITLELAAYVQAASAIPVTAHGHTSRSLHDESGVRDQFSAQRPMPAKVDTLQDLQPERKLTGPVREISGNPQRPVDKALVGALHGDLARNTASERDPKSAKASFLNTTSRTQELESLRTPGSDTLTPDGRATAPASGTATYSNFTDRAQFLHTLTETQTDTQRTVLNTQADQANQANAMPFGSSPQINPVQASQPSLTQASLTIATPLYQQGWGSDFSQQFVMLARHAEHRPQTAELRLDPPELGPIRISLSINDNVANAVFTSAHGAVRQAVENALPQLAQQLSHAGISLGQADVSDHSQSQHASHTPGQADRIGLAEGKVSASAGVDPGTLNTLRTRAVATDALIDTFA